LIEQRLVGKNDLVKIMGRGVLSTTVTVNAHKFTATAKSAIEVAGGKTQIV
jgi:large subunit ribosomal protein L15